MRLTDERRAWIEQALTRGDDASKRDALVLALMLREVLTYLDAEVRAHDRLLRELAERGYEFPEDTTT